MSKRLVELFAKVAGQKVGTCKGFKRNACENGKVIKRGYPRMDNPQGDVYEVDCPACRRLREIRDWKWLDEESLCVLNKRMISKPFTVQSVRALLENIGEWEGFISYLNTVNHKTIWDYADILTSDPLMTEAAIAYLETILKRGKESE